jgi:peptidyl-dipeptidase A
VKLRPALLAIAIVATLGLSACKREDAATPGASAVPAGETADQFIARVNTEFRKSYSELTSAQWLSSTYINSDTEALAAKANERWLTQLNGWIEQSRRFEGQQMSPGTARAIKLLKLMTAMPAPKDPQKLEELTKLATRMEGMKCSPPAATTTPSSMPGRVGTPSASRCARTTSASPNWSTKAPGTWASPMPAKCGGQATT